MERDETKWLTTDQINTILRSEDRVSEVPFDRKAFFGQIGQETPDEVPGRKTKTSGFSTASMGGVVITPQELYEMHSSDYILHAKDGQLRKVPVVKTPLPIDPTGHVQTVALFGNQGGTLWAVQRTIVSRSNDRGNSWEHLYHEPPDGWTWSLTSGFDWSLTSGFEGMRVLADGTWIKHDHYAKGDIPILKSTDEGLTWQNISTIAKSPGSTETEMSGLELRRDGTVMVCASAHFKPQLGNYVALLYHSNDGGRSFEPPTTICKFGSEINLTELVSGKLLAAIRYQRGAMAGDPPEVWEREGWGYKHLFVADSSDGGKTWSPARPLTTVPGQCHGAAAGLRDGRVVLIHDHRYPRGFSSARAIVSDDEGQRWNDEVYYLTHGYPSAGYARTVTFDGKEMLTLTGSFHGDASSSWEDQLGRSQHKIIHWQLED